MTSYKRLFVSFTFTSPLNQTL